MLQNFLKLGASQFKRLEHEMLEPRAMLAAMPGLLKDLNTGSNSSSPVDFLTIGSVTYFVADGTGVGRELFKTTGDAASTVLLANINGGPASTNPTNLHDHNGTLYFTAEDYLYSTDGTTVSYVGVAIDAQQLVSVGSDLYFLAKTLTPNVGLQVWRLSSGTISLISAGYLSANNLFSLDGTVFFSAFDANRGTELWTTPGTSFGTHVVEDINPGATPAGWPNNSLPDELTYYNGDLYFAATTALYGRELWTLSTSDFDARMVADLNPGAGTSNPSELTVYNGELYFAATTPTTGRELYKLDAGGDVSLVKDINPGIAGSNPSNLAAAGGRLYFGATTPATGAEPWSSQGTAGTTLLLKDILPGTTGSLGNPEFTTVSGRVFFAATVLNVSGTELYSTDGTTAGTVSYDTLPGPNSPPVSHLHAGNRRLYFSGASVATGVEPWTIVATIPGDANLDGRVDGADYTIWSDHYLQSPAAWTDADFTGDSMVDGADYNVWSDHYGQVAPSPSAPVPSTVRVSSRAAVGQMSLDLGLSVRARVDAAITLLTADLENSKSLKVGGGRRNYFV